MCAFDRNLDYPFLVSELQDYDVPKCPNSRPRSLLRGTLWWVSKGARSIPLVKGGVNAPPAKTSTTQALAPCGASLLRINIGKPHLPL
jgi:hypothetical protein